MLLKTSVWLEAQTQLLRAIKLKAKMSSHIRRPTKETRLSEAPMAQLTPSLARNEKMRKTIKSAARKI